MGGQKYVVYVTTSWLCTEDEQLLPVSRGVKSVSKSHCYVSIYDINLVIQTLSNAHDIQNFCKSWGTKMSEKTEILLKWSWYHQRPNHVRLIYTYSGASCRTNECRYFFLDSRWGTNKYSVRCDILDNAWNIYGCGVGVWSPTLMHLPHDMRASSIWVQCNLPPMKVNRLKFQYYSTSFKHTRIVVEFLEHESHNFLRKSILNCSTFYSICREKHGLNWFHESKNDS